MYQEIFKQGKIGNITLKNRLVMSPMGTSLAEMDGSPSEDMIAFYEARAIGGAALIIPEIARVNDLHGAGMMRQLSVSKDWRILCRTLFCKIKGVILCRHLKIFYIFFLIWVTHC